MSTRSRVVVGVLAFLLVLAGSAAGQSSWQPEATAPDDVIVYVPMKPITNPDGPRVYQDHCGVCHGATLHGNGRAVRYLRQPVPDLTLIALRDGRFDEQHVLAHIKNLDAQTTPMPHWGRSWRVGGTEPAVNALVLTNLTRFLEAMQEVR
jgi:mono/diheme cytochrome c family protein